MRRESPTRSLSISTQPLPQCHSNPLKSLLHYQCNRKQLRQLRHQINKRNNHPIAEHTHVPRRPCYFSDNVSLVMKLVEGGAIDPTNIPKRLKLDLNHTLSQSYRIDIPSQNNSSFAGHCMQLVQLLHHYNDDLLHISNSICNKEREVRGGGGGGC